MLELFLAAAAIGHGSALPTFAGVVLTPEGGRLAGAKITASTACEGQRAILLTDAISGPDGRFSIEAPASDCRRVQFQVQKDEDLWLQTGEWKEFFEEGDSLPIVDTAPEMTGPLVLHVQERGAELTVRVTDGSTERPGRVAIMRCAGRATNWEMDTDTVDDAGAPFSQVVPGGSYCVALMSADLPSGRLYSRTRTCVPIELSVGQRRMYTIRFNPQEMQSTWKWQPVNCPGGQPRR